MAKYDFSVRVNGKNVTTYQHNGETYIEGRKGTEYTLYFQNNTSDDVCVIMSIDGLSINDGKHAGTNSQGYIVNSWCNIEIPGWKINSGKAAKFKFSPAGDRDQTYVEALKADGLNVNPSNMGVIGAMVFRRKMYVHAYASPFLYGKPNIRSINCSASMGFAASETVATLGCNSTVPTLGWNDTPEQSIGTGFGNETNFNTVTTTFHREDNPDLITVIHYDTLRNLERKGVPIRPQTASAKAFPNMVNDGAPIPSNWKR